MNRQQILNEIKKIALSEKNIVKLYNKISEAVIDGISSDWEKCENKQGRKAYYFSMEYLVGRAFFNNLLELNLLDEIKQILHNCGMDINAFEEIEDAALGNGGLGRLAACFLDSAANLGLPLNGRGIRYKYGLFKQQIINGFQTEIPDDWQRFGDPWGIRKKQETRKIEFKNLSVNAVPYDYPITGKNGSINTLRLWQAEGNLEAEKISEYLYPDDSTDNGKLLRIKQEYFFSAASIGELLEKHAGNITDFPTLNVIQLNDTHPVFAIAEFVRLLVSDYGTDFKDAVNLARQTFNYTNHTIMSEALERWDGKLIKKILPEIYEVMKKIDTYSKKEFKSKGCNAESIKSMEIYDGKMFSMANLASFISANINGVAKLHTEILKAETLNEIYKFSPEKFKNVTNGITQRRWLMLCNPELSSFIDKKIGKDWRQDITKINELKKHTEIATLNEFLQIKKTKKVQLSEYIKAKEGIELNPDSIFYVQIKRLHEYKRQFMAILGILSIYNGIKDGSIKNFYPSTFIFGAKAAASYKRAKAVIKFINEAAHLINNDPETKNLLRVVFVENYNVSYAEKIIPAADVSLQISTAGTEASGTGNMKFMLNGAVTLGTLDGANIEIVALAGKENNYIFGADADKIQKLKAAYDPNKIIQKNPTIQKAIEFLTTLNDSKTGMFKDLLLSITQKTYNDADSYFILYDLTDFIKSLLAVNKDYQMKDFTSKLLINIASAAYFSSDRTVKEYADNIWKI